MTTSTNGPKTAALLALLSCQLLVSCDACSARPVLRRTEHAPPTAGDLNYPLGPWWRDRALNNVLLSVDHILIAFEGCSTRAGNFAVDHPPSQRSVAQAYRLATELAARAQRNPGAFDELAAQHSDDRFSARFGGHIGVIAATLLPGPMVDAIGHIEPGQISHVIRTELGFHIVRRSPLPEEERLSGQAITILHESVHAMVRPGHSGSKSRTPEQALELAQRIAREARAHPDHFGQLWNEYGDAFAQPGGDLGEWSNRDPQVDYQATTVLQRLSVGAISAPVAHPAYGYRIFKRSAPRPRLELADSRFIIAHTYPLDPAAKGLDPSVTRSREQAAALAKSTMIELAAHPERFDALREKFCDYASCKRKPRSYTQGRSGLGGLDRELAKVAVGEILPAPLEIPVGFVFARREDPAQYRTQRPVVRLELPRPPPATLETASNRQLAGFTRFFERKAVEKLRLDSNEAERFSRIVEDLALAFESAPVSERQALHADAMRRLREALGDKRADEIARFSERLQAAVQGG